MSIIRIAPGFIATIQTGAVVRVISGGAPIGSKVIGAWIEERPCLTFCVEVEDGVPGVREIVFERVP